MSVKHIKLGCVPSRKRSNYELWKGCNKPCSFWHVLLELIIDGIPGHCFPQDQVFLLRGWRFLECLEKCSTWGQGGCKNRGDFKGSDLSGIVAVEDANGRVAFHHHESWPIFAEPCRSAGNSLQLNTWLAIVEGRSSPYWECFRFSNWKKKSNKYKILIRKKFFIQKIIVWSFSLKILLNLNLIFQLKINEKCSSKIRQTKFNHLISHAECWISKNLKMRTIKHIASDLKFSLSCFPALLPPLPLRIYLPTRHHFHLKWKSK